MHALYFSKHHVSAVYYAGELPVMMPLSVTQVSWDHRMFHVLTAEVLVKGGLFISIENSACIIEYFKTFNGVVNHARSCGMGPICCTFQGLPTLPQRILPLCSDRPVRQLHPDLPVFPFLLSFFIQSYPCFFFF